ncbi:MAG: hypothetical protein LBS97_02620 [Treponema sp.]|jgi:hypothetical protein|nr:hypothetical protein [Treponema sp.]
MKVTAIIADELVQNMKEYTHSSTVTEAITIALKDWLDLYAVKKLNAQIAQRSLFLEPADKIRAINRQL